MNLLEVQPRIFSAGRVPDDLSMNGTRNAVLQLEVHLGNSVFWEYGSVRDITCENVSRKHFLLFVESLPELQRLPKSSRVTYE